MVGSYYFIDTKKLEIPDGYNAEEVLYREKRINSKKKKKGIEAIIYTNAQRNALRSFLKKYKYPKELLSDLFNKEHLELKENKNSIDNMRNSKIYESKKKDEAGVLSYDEIEGLGVRISSLAKIIGVVYQQDFVDAEEEVDADALYDVLAERWDEVIDMFDKANEAFADELDEAKSDPDDEKIEPVYELDEVLSNGEVTLEDLGVVDGESLLELIELIKNDKDIETLLGDNGGAWKSDTDLEDIDPLAAFDDLCEKLLGEGISEEESEEKADGEDGEIEYQIEFDEPIEESAAAKFIKNAMNENAKFIRTTEETAAGKYITECMNSKVSFARVSDIEREAYSRGKRASVNEGAVSVNGKEIEFADKAPKGTKAAPVSEKELKVCLANNLKAAKQIAKDESVSKEIRKAVSSLSNSSSCEDFEEVIAKCKSEKYAVKKELIKALEVAKTCACTLASSKNESVTAKFAKYRRMFEGEEEAKSETGAAEDESEPEENKEAEEEEKKGEEEKSEEEGEGDAIEFKIKKKEDAECDDIVAKIKEDLIDAGVKEEHIEIVDGDKDSDEITIKIDGESIKELLEFGKKHNIDFEDLCGCEFDIEDEEEKKDDEEEKKDGEEGEESSDDDLDLGDDDMWASIFGGADEEEDEKKEEKK